jgi:putative membrane protein
VGEEKKRVNDTMTVHDLPAVNASLNGLSTIFILAGYWFIKTDRKQPHIAAMAAALMTSTLFLTCYGIYHAHHIVTYFTHSGWPRVVYRVILFTHIPLAFVVLPLVVLTVVPALRARYDRHRRLARWALPIWLYVSVTGVLVYLMLYQWYPPALSAAAK